MIYGLTVCFIVLVVLVIARILIWIIEKIIGERDPLRLVLPILTILVSLFLSIVGKEYGKEYLVTCIILGIAGIVWLVYNLMKHMLKDFLGVLPVAVIAIGAFVFMASLAHDSVLGVVCGSIITIAGIAWPIVGSILKKQKKREWDAETERLKQSALQGDANAQYQLGERYRSKGNLEEGKKWFGMAAGSGHEKAKRIVTDIAAEKRATEERAAKKAREEKMAEDEFQRCKALIVQEYQGKCMLCESFKALDSNEAICASLLSPRRNQFVDGDASCSDWKIQPDSYIRGMVSILKGK